jgi:glutamate--cysteine ligase catalytic subunit
VGLRPLAPDSFVPRQIKVDEKPPPQSRHLTRSNLKPNQIPMTLTSFPRLGVPGKFTEPYYDPAEAVSSHSLFLPDEITNPHARFPYVP